MGDVETEEPDEKPDRGRLRSPDTLTRWFLAMWRWLDESPLRQVWPLGFGILLAAGAVQLTGKTLWAALIVLVVYISIYRTATKAMLHDQAVRKTLD